MTDPADTADTADTIEPAAPANPGPAPAALDARINLVGLSREELEATVTGLGLPKFRARQIWHWIYHRGARGFDEMTTLAKGLRGELAEKCVLSRPSIISEQLSEDKTRKWLMNVPGGGAVETVFIPEEDRGALCLVAARGGASTVNTIQYVSPTMARARATTTRRFM